MSDDLDDFEDPDEHVVLIGALVITVILLALTVAAFAVFS